MLECLCHLKHELLFRFQDIIRHLPTAVILAKSALEEANELLYFALESLVETVLKRVCGSLRTTSSSNKILTNLAPKRGTILVRANCCIRWHVCLGACQLRVFIIPEVWLTFGTPARRWRATVGVTEHVVVHAGEEGSEEIVRGSNGRQQRRWWSMARNFERTARTNSRKFGRANWRAIKTACHV